ncbi:MAG TPA: PAS domain-containing protein [Allosphingosinicella sp.]
MSAEPGVPATNMDELFLSGGGDMGAAMRALDWSKTPLGPPATWPQPLKTTVGIMLGSKFPMFLAWGPDLTFLYNDGYTEILGAKHPALGQRFEDVWAEIWSDIGPLAERALAGEATYFENLPLTMVRRGAPEQTWFTFSYSPLADEHGRVRGILCACVETTATVLADRRRAGEAERLRQLFDNAPGFMAVLSGRDHVFDLANAAYMRLVGHRDIIGRNVREALPEISGQGFVRLLDEVYETGRPFSGVAVDVVLRREEDGAPEKRLVDFVYQPIRDEAGNVTGIFCEGYDVTARHTAELKLRESEERFRLIADSAPVPMWVTRLDRKRAFVNQAYADFLGVSYEEAIDFDWRSRIHPEDVDGIVHESLAGEATLQPFTLEGRYRRGDGEWRWLRSESQPRWGPDGEHEGFIGVAFDITASKVAEAALREVNETLERRVAERTSDLSAALERLRAEVAERERAEEALRQAQKMEAVGQLTGGIAHDFNNLLTPILGGLEMISTRIDDVRLKRVSETALESARRGAKLTSQLLAFSRIQRLAMKPVEVNAVIANMRQILKHTIGTGIEIRTEFDPAAGRAICDENQLENALLNLAINARDAMEGGGTLTISTICTEEAAGSPDLEPGAYVCITVEDTGAGMAPDILARAIEPFFSTKPLGKGTGLGLAQVYGIAQQSGGTLRIESRPGEGTKVHILLPRARGDEASEGAPADAAPGRATEPQAPRARILVVDDDPDVRGFLQDVLDDLGHEVTACDGGPAALDQVERDCPDLLLLDFAMPGMNGAEVARLVRARCPTLPIVFVTGYAESEQLEAALGSDVTVLRKPFSVDELAAAVAENASSSA